MFDISSLDATIWSYSACADSDGAPNDGAGIAGSPNNEVICDCIDDLSIVFSAIVGSLSGFDPPALNDAIEAFNSFTADAGNPLVASPFVGD